LTLARPRGLCTALLVLGLTAKERTQELENVVSMIYCVPFFVQVLADLRFFPFNSMDISRIIA